MKFKKIWTILLVKICFTGSGFSENEFNLNLVNQRIHNMIQLRLHFNVSVINVHNRNSHDEFIALTNICKDHWQAILENIDELEGEQNGKALVFEAMQFLPPESYMQAFEWMADKLVADEFSKDIISGIMNSPGLMVHFFADNYEHPRVIAALQKIKSKSGNDNALISRINNVLSGNRKESVDHYREAHQDVEEVPPVILLPH
jgi:hypothetical protein